LVGHASKQGREQRGEEKNEGHGDGEHADSHDEDNNDGEEDEEDYEIFQEDEDDDSEDGRGCQEGKAERAERQTRQKEGKKLDLEGGPKAERTERVVKLQRSPWLHIDRDYRKKTTIEILAGIFKES
jgi:hypothetical protein